MSINGFFFETRIKSKNITNKKDLKSDIRMLCYKLFRQLKYNNRERVRQHEYRITFFQIHMLSLVDICFSLFILNNT